MLNADKHRTQCLVGKGFYFVTQMILAVTADGYGADNNHTPYPVMLTRFWKRLSKGAGEFHDQSANRTLLGASKGVLNSNPWRRRQKYTKWTGHPLNAD